MPRSTHSAAARAADAQATSVDPDRRTLYEGLVTRHAALLERVARRLCSDRTAADDIVQDTYVEAWRSIGSLRDPAKGRPWLLGILRHRFARFARKAARTPRPSAEATERASERAAPGRDVLTRMADRETVERALAALPDIFREALLLVVVDGLTPAEAGDLLDVARGTVLSRVHRARRLLRAGLADENETGDSR